MQLLPLESATQTLHACRLVFLRVTLAVSIETFARFQAGFLSSEDFHRFLSIFIDFVDFDGLLGLLGLLEGVLCFLALLEGGLKHVVSHARRSGEVGGYYLRLINGLIG